MANKKNSFEEQIGNLGGEPVGSSPDTQANDSLIGQKLRHIPGQKNDLSQEENSEFQAFMKRSNRNHNDGENYEYPTIPISEGWIPIDRKEMGIRSQFYPEDWVFSVRPATVEAIKNWSSIDEERLDIVNNVFNDIIRTCVKISSASGNIPWSRLNSWDRFWFILKVREYTFSKGEAKIEFKDTCPECEEELTYTLTPQALAYEFPDDSIVEKHWNSVERAWYIDPKDYDLDRPVVKLYVPTLEKDKAILDWAISKSRSQKKQLDEVFLRFLPWMLSKAPKDEEVLDKFIRECETQYKKWDVEMFEFMDEVVRNIIINPSEKLKQVCPHCGEEVMSNVRFPDGVKVLFKTEAKHKRFGSR